MKRSVIALAAVMSLAAALMIAPVAHANAPSTWTVTAADVAVADVPAAQPAAPAPEAQRFAVVATAKLGDAIVGQAVYPDKDFDSEAACKAALDGGDAALKEANDGLKARVEAKLPGVEVSFQCVAE